MRARKLELVLHCPEQPAVPHPAHQATPEAMDSGYDALDSLWNVPRIYGWGVSHADEGADYFASQRSDSRRELPRKVFADDHHGNAAGVDAIFAHQNL